VIVGAYYFDSITDDWGYFTQATVQSALDHSTMAGGSYKPGDNLNASIGVRYKGFQSFTPTAQLNARYAKVDSGDAADTYSTGGKLVYLTLGAIVPVSGNVTPYANLQIPIYQNVNGIQLTPRYTVSVGAKVTF
jgi:hypothetical protein